MELLSLKNVNIFVDFYVFLGLPQGSKPPPLTMVSPAVKAARTTATVQPLSQGLSSSNVMSQGSNTAMSATRASSFAAALQKLAIQAGDIGQSCYLHIKLFPNLLRCQPFDI